MLLADTIAAISSAPAPSARIIVRLTGHNAHAIAAALLTVPFPPPASATLCQIAIAKSPIPAWLYYFAGPHSATGQDIVEFHIPGSPFLASRLLADLLERGARHADPGEFTARAYLNGKIDLAQAEGVAALIAAEDDSSLRAARALASGELSTRIAPIIDNLAQSLALVEAGIDFVDEDITFLADADLAATLAAADQNLADIQQTSHRLAPAAIQPTIILVGRPNAGKSTLLNALARSDRAIVSPQIGTTRDTLTATIHLPHGQVTLIDSPGLEIELAHHSTIDRQSQRRARDEIAQSDFIILVQDITDARPPIALPRAADLVIRTKSDLAPAPAALAVSATTGQGITDLRARIDELAFARRAAPAARLALTARHAQAIIDARLALAAAQSQLQSGPEIVALELRAAVDALGAITGAVSTEDILGRVFAAFCIGK